MTEDEAKTKWCPFVRLISVSVKADKISSPMNRIVTDDDPGLNPPACRCIGSECMAWRWDHEANREVREESTSWGYCGLAGKP